MFQFPLHRDPRCNEKQHIWYSGSDLFQFPLHRDPRCNYFATDEEAVLKAFQFPLHRDPRCNPTKAAAGATALFRFSSLYIGILAATETVKDHERRIVACFSSLYIGILAATSKEG